MSSLINPTPRLRTRPRVPVRVSSIPGKPSHATGLSIRMSRMLWQRRAQSWDRDGSAGLAQVVRTVLAACGETSHAVAIDLGCGSGQVTLPLAPQCRHVAAIDIDPQAIEMLRARATRQGLANVQAVVRPLETLDLAPSSVDLVVSNYALHHLRDGDKRLLLERCFAWLRPSGRLVIGDMMFGRGGDRTDRGIIRGKLRVLVRRGPAGGWRILKNGWRFTLRVQEKPVRPAAWEAIVRQAGFADVQKTHVVAEAYVLSATKPADD